MPDASKEFQIAVTTKAGADAVGPLQDVAKKMGEIREQTALATPVIRDYAAAQDSAAEAAERTARAEASAAKAVEERRNKGGQSALATDPAQFRGDLAGETEEAAKALALEQQRLGIQSQRQAIVEADAELSTARAAGDAERIAALEAEVAIRTRSLQIQRATTLSEEEAAVIAEKQYADELRVTAAEEKQLALKKLQKVEDEQRLALARAQENILARQAVKQQQFQRTALERVGSGLSIGGLGAGLAGGAAGVAAILALDLAMQGVIKLFHYFSEAGAEASAQAKTTEISMRDLGRATGETAEKNELIEKRAKAATAAYEEQRKAIDEVTKAFEKQRKAEDELLDAKTQADLAQINADESTGFTSKQDADRARADIRLADTQRKIEGQERAIRGPLEAAQQADAAARQAAQDSPARLAAARDVFNAANAKARDLVPQFQFKNGRDAREYADRYEPAEGSDPQRTTRAAQQADVLREVAAADEALAVRRRQDAAAQAAAPVAAAVLNDALSKAAPALQILQNQRRGLGADAGGEATRRVQSDRAGYNALEDANPSAYVPPSAPAPTPRARPEARIFDETGDRTKEIEQLQKTNAELMSAIVAMNKDQQLALSQIKAGRLYS